MSFNGIAVSTGNMRMIIVLYQDNRFVLQFYLIICGRIKKNSIITISNTQGNSLFEMKLEISDGEIIMR